MGQSRSRPQPPAAGGPAPFDADQLLARWRPTLEPYLATLARAEQREHALCYLAGLLSALPRKSTETIAYAFNQPRHGLQHFLGASTWDWGGLLDYLAGQIDAALAEADGVRSLHLVGFPKKGPASVGVGRQRAASDGSAENQQLAVYLGYATRQGAGLIDTALYLPRDWARDRARRRRCGVPTRLTYRRLGQLAVDLLVRHRGHLPRAWVTADAGLGWQPEFRLLLRDLGEPYLVRVPGSLPVRTPEEGGRRAFRPAWEATASPPGTVWGPTLAGHRLPEVVAVPVVTQVTRRAEQRETLVVFTATGQGPTEASYYLSNASADLPAEAWSRAAAGLTRATAYLEEAKAAVAMASYEVRTWEGWHHHQTLALIAAWARRHG